MFVCLCVYVHVIIYMYVYLVYTHVWYLHISIYSYSVNGIGIKKYSLLQDVQRTLHIQKLSRVHSKWLYVQRREKQQQCPPPPQNMLGPFSVCCQLPHYLKLSGVVGIGLPSDFIFINSYICVKSSNLGPSQI